MKTKSVLKKLKLKEEDFETIKKAVEKAEAQTTGEIAIALAPESAHYSYWELLASNIFAAFVLIGLFPLANAIRNLYRAIYWQNEPGWILPVFYIVSCFAAIAIGFYLCNIPAIDRLIIPAKVKQHNVTNRAMRYFTESAVYETAEHSGILIYVSYLERQVRIIADSGISKKISQDLWNLIADELAENLKKGNATEGFTNAINRCGELLAEHFPAKEENPNELQDGLVILEDAEWN